jgi:hypothetical protein
LAFANALGEHLVVNRYAWVILGNEPTIDAVATLASLDWVRDIFPIDLRRSEHALDRIMCKATFTEAADAAGIRVPPSWGCLTVADLNHAIDALGLPVIIKPTRGWAGDGVFAIRDRTEIETIFDKARLRAPLIVQRLLAGDVGSTQMLLDHGTPVCWFSSFKRQVWPGEFGPSCVREIFEDPQIEPILTKIGEVTGFHGLCGIDWLRGADGQISVLEFNPRPTPSMDVGRFAGVDFSRSIAAMVSGSRLVQRPRTVRGLMVYLFPQHPTRCMMTHDLAGLSKWLPFVARHSVPWNEPSILLGDSRILLRQFATMIKSDVRRSIIAFKRWVKRLLHLHRSESAAPPRAPAPRAG